MHDDVTNLYNSKMTWIHQDSCGERRRCDDVLYNYIHKLILAVFHVWVWIQKRAYSHFVRIFQMLWPNLIIVGTYKRQVMTNSVMQKFNNDIFTMKAKLKWIRTTCFCSRTACRLTLSETQSAICTLHSKKSPLSNLLWPANSPDLNLVGFAVWGALQQRVYCDDCLKMKQAIVDEWYALSQKFSRYTLKQRALV